jgi:hypothetical protein
MYLKRQYDMGLNKAIFHNRQLAANGIDEQALDLAAFVIP